jgi:hypothetical protein
VTLADFAMLLARYADGALGADVLAAHVGTVIASDALGAERGDDARWAADHESERLLWRLLYLFDAAMASPGDDAAQRARARRVVACLTSTQSPALTYELLPMVLDQDRFATIVARHVDGIISRTGFLSVIAESGYADHAKLWLQHAPPDALVQLCERLERGDYVAAAATLERAPGR